MSEFIMLPCYKLASDKITLYSIPEKRHVSELEKLTWNNLRDNENKYNEISEQAQKRLLEKLNILLYITKTKELAGFSNKKITSNNEFTVLKKNKHAQKTNYKLGMITLTLSGTQHNSDEEIKRDLLNNFLTEIKRKYDVVNYIWKAEKQANGNIHFHIIIDKYIHYAEITALWNRIQNKDGYNYVDIYQAAMKKKYENGFLVDKNVNIPVDVQKERYKKGLENNWTKPNSTDIHSLKNAKNAAAYITKYLAKGVTKDDRINEMKKVYNKLQAVEKYMTKLTNCIMLNLKDEKKMKKIDEKLTNTSDVRHALIKEIENLKKQGVSGRIYGISQNLSKLRNYSDVEEHHNIPDIEIIEKEKRHTSVLNIGNSQAVTHYFDIKKTKKLDNLLTNHFKAQLLEITENNSL